MSAIKKAVKSVGRFVKKHAKKILIAAAVVFTAGIATVGVGGFSAAMAAAGGGIKGALVAVGSTLKAGVLSIGGTLGIGKGVTATNTLVGARSAAVGGALASGASGATLLNGAAAQALGIGKAAAAAKSAGSALSTAGTSTAAPLGSGLTSAYGSGMSTAAPLGSGLTSAFGAPAVAGPITSATPFAGTQAAAASNTFGSTALNSAGAFNAASGAAGAAGTIGATAPVATNAGGFLNSAVGSALVSGGLNAMSSYMAAKAQEEDEAINALYGVSPRDGDTSLTPEQVRFASAPENRNSWRPRLMYDA